MTEEKTLQILFTEISHNCKQITSSLFFCCEERRCEVCHVSHLKEKHSQLSLSTFWRFQQSSRIVHGKDTRTSKPLKEKKKRKEGEKLDMVDSVVGKLSREEFISFYNSLKQG